MVSRFYWLIDAQLAGCSRPGAEDRRGRGAIPWAAQEDTAQAGLDRDLSWLRDQGIGALLSLTETPLEWQALARSGLETLHLPVHDLRAPSPDEFVHALAFIDRQRLAGRAVAVHCLAGQGRTGTILAAHRIRSGAPADEALRELRTICPGAIGSQEQEQALLRFAARRGWLV